MNHEALLAKLSRFDLEKRISFAGRDSALQATGKAVAGGEVLEMGSIWTRKLREKKRKEAFET